MDLKTYLKVSAINLIFLLLGLLLGIGLRTETPAVHAQAKQAQTTDSVSTRDGVSTKVTLDPNAEYVSPGVSLGGPVVTNTLLANRIACDRLQVNGFEPLRISDAILSALVKKGYLEQAEVKAIIEAGKADHPLRVKPQ